MTIYEDLKPKTDALEAAVYAALDACDAYREAVVTHLAAEESKPDPNAMVVKRLRQFDKRSDTITRIVEDDVITELLFCIDRLAMLELAERGEFI